MKQQINQEAAIFNTLLSIALQNGSPVSDSEAIVNSFLSLATQHNKNFTFDSAGAILQQAVRGYSLEDLVVAFKSDVEFIEPTEEEIAE